MRIETSQQIATADDLARTLEHLTRALLDPAPSRVEQPRVAAVPAAAVTPAADPGTEAVLPEPIVLRPRRGSDLLAELAFLDP